MFMSTRFGGVLACLLAGFSIVGAAAFLLTGAPASVKGILIGCILFNAGVLAFAASYFLRGRNIEHRTTAGLILFVICFASAIGTIIVSSKGGPALLVGLHCLANLVAFSAFVWDLEDDR
jgi:membrane protein CcdC involved in cytochrome C biogenesis